MDKQKEKIETVYTQFTQKMSELFTRKKKLISDFKRRLETRKVDTLKNELMNR